MEKSKKFSSEIVEFSKLVDGVFSVISKDIVELKLKLNESVKEVVTLKALLKKEIEKNTSDSSITKGKLNELHKEVHTTKKNLKRANVVSETKRPTVKRDDDYKVLESMLTNLNERIRTIENKLKI